MTIHEPLKFVKNITKNKHVLLLYENLQWAKIIEFEFIQEGLRKNEFCAYASIEKPEYIKKQMSDFGIDVKNNSNQLSIHQLPKHYNYSKNTFEQIYNEFKKIVSGVKKPIRVVGTLVSEVEQIQYMMMELKFEKLFHDDFKNFNGTWICPYNISKIHRENKVEWIKKLIEIHHSTIFASTVNLGSVFDFNRD